ncbi:helix-turn-helix transcriptional regulator (plasmid) [Rhizobium sp. NIBRBAC000502774]|nr:helix-turn-helix transcriptional regulator [Rhizobium sp. NIBRBAC000502774]
MLSLPVPIVVAILLVVLFFYVATRDRGVPTNIPLLLLILVSALQSLLLGLRWGFGVPGVRYLAPVVAATVPALVYVGVAQLVMRKKFSSLQQNALHALPAVSMVALMSFWHEAIDIALISIFIAYAAAILRLMRPGTDALRHAAFDGAVPAYRAILFAAAALLMLALMDTFVFLDLASANDHRAMLAITSGNMFALIVLSVASAAASRGQVSLANTEVEEVPDVAGDAETMSVVHALMDEKKAYRDSDLTLDRLSRKVSIQVRQISGAINRTTGKNVSQYVNEFRIAEACSLLTNSDKSVTEIMLHVGFQTKSNFNREFRRLTDMTPLEWREKTISGT